MPTARLVLASTVVNGVIYAIGGEHSSAVLGTVEAYDPVSDTRTTKASMPTARFALSTSVVNGIIYAVGGTPLFWGRTKPLRPRPRALPKSSNQSIPMGQVCLPPNAAAYR